MMMGPAYYGLAIGLPSADEWSSNKNYYERPWEVTADLLGSVSSLSRDNGRRGFRSQMRENRGWSYLITSILFGTLTYFGIIGEY